MGMLIIKRAKTRPIGGARDLDGPILRDEQVVEFEIAVEDAIGSEPEHALKDLTNHLTAQLE